MFIIAMLIWSQLGLISTKAASDGFTTILNADDTLTITGWSGGLPIGDLDIPSTLPYGGVDKKVTVIKDWAFWNKGITNVTIPHTVKQIGLLAFAENQLTTVTFEDESELKEIASSAFHTNMLTTIKIPASVQKIGTNAFENNQLTSVTFESESKLEKIEMSAFKRNMLPIIKIPASVQKIGQEAFISNRLASVTFEDESKLEEIGPNAFVSFGQDENDNHIEVITIPASVMNIGSFAFFGNKLKTVIFEQGSHLESIGNNAFASNQLESIIFPSSIKTIESSAFEKNNLEKIEFKEPANPPITVGANAFKFQNNVQETPWYLNGNESTPWDQATVTTAFKAYSEPQALPPKPTNITAVAGNGEATVSFTTGDSASVVTGDSAGVIMHKVKVYVGGHEQVGLQATGTQSPITVTGLTNGTTYTFRVVAMQGIVESEDSDESNSVTLIAPATKPGAPTMLSATALFGAATVTFSLPASDGGSAITGYKVKVYENGIEKPSLEKISTETTPNIGNILIVTVPNLTNGLPYTFKVVAINGIGDSEESAMSNPPIIPTMPIIPPPITTVPFAPTGVTALAGDEQATVNFMAPMYNGGSPVTGYKVKVYVDGVEKPTLQATGVMSPITVTGLTNNTTYTFKVVATNSIGDSAESLESNAVTPGADGFITTSNGDDTVKITGYNGTVPAQLVIPAEINGKPVSIIGSTAFMFKNITSVVIPEGIKKIDTSAFSGNLLTNVVIPSTMEEIGSTAFKGNKLETVEFKGAVSTIDGSAFVSQDVTPEFTGWYTDRSMQPSTLWNGTIPQAMTIYSTGILGYMVTFNTNGGSDIAPKFVTQGESITAPSAPTRSGYTFAGWYKDSTLQTVWNFATDKVTRNTTLYAKWTAVPTTNPPVVTSPSGSNSTPSTTTEIRVDVVDASNPDAVLVQTVITRETNNGIVKDTVNFTSANAREAIEKLANQQNKQSRMVIPDEQQQVSETNISIGREAAELLTTAGTGLGIDMETVKFDIPATSFANINSDIYFRVVPVKAQATKQQLEQRAKTEEIVKQLTSTTVTVLGQPMTIETNMQNRPVTLTLPLPNNVTQEQLDNLAVYIEHSDGTKEVIHGQIVDFKEATKGIQFSVTKFSTFTILYTPVEKEETVVENPVSIPYIQGYADGTFRPNASVTRAQMASMLARHLTNNEIPTAPPSFKDTAKHGAKDAIEYVKAQGLFQGTTATTFQPNGTITRAQMAAVVVRWMEQQGAELTFDTKSTFTDVKANHWAAEAIAKVHALGIMTGTSQTTFNPEGALTRAQAVKVLNQLFELEVQASERAPLFKDVTSAHWAFDDIQAAAQ